MSNTTEGMVSGAGTPAEPQTPQNTVAPFEAVPSPTSEQPEKKKYVRPPRTKAYREAKAAEYVAAGRSKPGRKSKAELEAIAAEAIAAAEAADLYDEDTANELLKRIVDKLVALENDAQYKSVWVHFFQFGGVYNGPNYLEELTDAIAYLQHIGK